MQLNVLNDLAEAMKALDGKKGLECVIFLAQWIMYRSNSFLFWMHIVYRTDVATDLIREFAIVFPAW